MLWLAAMPKLPYSFSGIWKNYFKARAGHFVDIIDFP